jgi:hypothetical protein
LLDASGARFIDGILDQRFINDRQHLFWHRLRCGQKSGAETRDRQNSFTQRLDQIALLNMQAGPS